MIYPLVGWFFVFFFPVNFLLVQIDRFAELRRSFLFSVFLYETAKEAKFFFFFTLLFKHANQPIFSFTTLIFLSFSFKQADVFSKSFQVIKPN